MSMGGARSKLGKLSWNGDVQDSADLPGTGLQSFLTCHTSDFEGRLLVSLGKSPIGALVVVSYFCTDLWAFRNHWGEADSSLSSQAFMTPSTIHVAISISYLFERALVL